MVSGMVLGTNDGECNMQLYTVNNSLSVCICYILYPIHDPLAEGLHSVESLDKVCKLHHRDALLPTRSLASK